ncbi:MAG: type I-C CRISPR-associated protein Cas8c/Csd1, partial [Bacteroidetes bacterium]|nr:type I-C CRISPR-associated protein Cas8c/Csd1 [Bacteroidota bacterium]
MIKELCEYGGPICEKKYGQWNHVALKEEFISIELVIDPDGSFREFISFEKKPTIAETLTAKKGKARLLLDKAEEVLCYGGNKSKKKHELFLSKLSKHRRMHELEPIFAFYNQNKINGIDKALKEFETAIPNEKYRKGNIGFRINAEGSRLHERPEILRNIIDEYDARKKKIPKRKCAVCNTDDYLVEDTPPRMIKLVPNGKTSGCALISYNEMAFESYALKGNYNSSICANCARTYVEGLNTLMSAG